jgi:peptide/nickel transport system substrate-binding protein
MPMTELLSHWYQQEERTADMIYMGSNFDLLFDPAAYFDKDGNWAYTSLKDRGLRSYAKSMITTKPGDVLTYMKHWISFQERFNEILPMIPIYGNFYYDFYTSKLQDYDISASVTWGEAIVPAYLK